MHVKLSTRGGRFDRVGALMGTWSDFSAHAESTMRQTVVSSHFCGSTRFAQSRSLHRSIVRIKLIAGIVRHRAEGRQIVETVIVSQRQSIDRLRISPPSPMTPMPIHLLLVEHRADDARRILAEIAQSKRVRFQTELAEGLAAAAERLGRGNVGVVLFDLSAPDGNALGRFRELKSRASTTPFVVLCSAADEQLALQAVQDGAHDYIVRDDVDSGTLEYVLRHALDQQGRRGHPQTEARYQSLVESLPLNVFRKDLGGRLVFANQRYCHEMGRPLGELIGKTDYELFPRRLAKNTGGTMPASWRPASPLRTSKNTASPTVKRSMCRSSKHRSETPTGTPRESRGCSGTFRPGGTRRRRCGRAMPVREPCPIEHHRHHYGALRTVRSSKPTTRFWK